MRGPKHEQSSSYHINHSNKVVHLKMGCERSLICLGLPCFKTKNALYSPPLQMCGPWPCTYPRRTYPHPPPKKKYSLPGALEHRRPLRQPLLSKEKPPLGVQSCHFRLQHTLKSLYTFSIQSIFTQKGAGRDLSPKAINEPPAPQALWEAPCPTLCFPKQVWDMFLASTLSDPA